VGAIYRRVKWRAEDLPAARERLNYRDVCSGFASARKANWLVTKGEMGRMIADHPWEKTSLGGLETWPVPLRMAVNLMLESGPPMAITWGKEFRLLYNDAYARVIQDKHPMALGRTGEEIFPEAWLAVQPLFETAMRGEAVLIDDFEVALTRGGTTKPAYFSFSYNPIRGESGEVDGVLAIVVETTAAVVREQERAETFDTVLSAITDFAYTFDRDGRFVYVNKALLDLWGLKLRDAVGKNFFDLKYPDDLAERLQRQIQQVIVEKRTVRDETRYVSPTGVDAYYEYIFSPVFAPDGSVRIVAGSTRDITRRKKLEMDALAASKAKDDFLATLSHELRTPLNPVLLLASEAARNVNLSDELRADFQMIAEHVTHEARLIDDLLDISRIIHDKLPLNLQPQDVHALLARVLKSIESEVKEKELILFHHFEATSARVLGDKVRLHQIFGNLLGNAVKFTPCGGRIGVSTRVRPDKGGTLVVEITDSGVGLTAAELSKVFTPFVQGEHTADGTSQFGGLGLGLAISRKLAELHFGSITGQSGGRGAGATFAVELPLDVSTGPDEAPVLIAPPAASRRSDIAQPRILLVEDHASSRRALARLLKARKIEVVQSSSASEALKKAKEQRFDLVISDIGLPDLSGYALMTQLKASYGFRGIALTGYGSQEDISRSKAAGFMAHLTKPVEAEALDAALEQFLVE
jgi:PAS domain S-box-containing protein